VPIGINPKQGLKYTWSPVEGLNNPNIANPVAGPDKTTEYIVTTTSGGGGCRTTDTVVVTASIIDDSLQLTGKENYCIGKNDSAVLHVNPTKSILWFKDGFAVNPVNETRYKVNTSGTYHALLKNTDGCSITTRKQPVIIEMPAVGITYPLEYTTQNSPLPLQARQIGESALWKPAVALNSEKSYTPVFTGTKDQLYTIELKTRIGCLTTDTLMVKIIQKIEIFVPTAFTPDNDGKNDLLRPVLYGVKELHFFKVFNRFGQLLFETNNARHGWDGIFKGIKQTTQTVVWMVKGVGVDGSVQTQKGTTVLLR
jgi:gliding motility-associated-like protein